MYLGKISKQERISREFLRAVKLCLQTNVDWRGYSLAEFRLYAPIKLRAAIGDLVKVMGEKPSSVVKVVTMHCEQMREDAAANLTEAVNLGLAIGARTASYSRLTQHPEYVTYRNAIWRYADSKFIKDFERAEKEVQFAMAYGLPEPWSGRR